MRWLGLLPVLLSGCAGPLAFSLSARTAAGDPLAPGDEVHSDESFALTAELDRPAYVYQLHQSPDGRVQVVRSLRAARGIVALSTLRLDQQPGLETAFVIASLRALSEAQLFALAAAQPRELLALAVLEKAKPTKPSPKPPPDCHKKQPQDCYRGPEPLRFTGRGVAVGRFQLNHK